MVERDIEKLLGGYATGTLTDEERHRLFEAALHDQALFDALTHEAALKEVLDDPTHRRRVLAALEAQQRSARRPLVVMLEWFRRPANVALAGTLATAVIAVWIFVAIERERTERPFADDLVAQVKQTAQPAEPHPDPSAGKDALERSGTGGKLEVGGTASEKKSAEADPGAEPRVAQDRSRAAGRAETGAVSKPRSGSQSATPEARARRMDPKRAIAPAAKQAESQRGASPEAPAPPAVSGFRVPPEKKEPQAAASGAPPAASAQGRPRWLTSYRRPVEPGPARHLYYARLAPAPRGETEEMSLSRQEEMEQAPERSQREPAEQTMSAEALTSLSAGVGLAELTPLGLRYSILKQDEAGDFAETNPGGPFKADDAMQVTVEVNEAGYLYVFRLGSRGDWRWITPAGPLGKEERKSGVGVLRGKRYVIPSAGVLPLYGAASANKMILIYSRQPRPELQVFHPAVLERQEGDERPSLDLDTLLSRARIGTSMQPLLVEQVQPDKPEGSQERAVYIVNPEAGRDAAIAIELTFPAD